MDKKNHKSDGVKRLDIHGLHLRHDLDIQFNERLNIIHGRNGSGKTTLLHILANLSEGAIGLFKYLKFKSIYLETFSGNTILLEKDRGPEKRSHIAVKLNGDVVVPDKPLHLTA